MAVFSRELDLSITHLLLWAGISGATYEEIGYYLISEGVAYDEKPLETVWQRITEALVNDCWLSVEEPEDRTEGENRTLPEIISDLECQALEYGILPSDFYGLTPREFIVILDHYGIKANYRAGLICSTIAQIQSPKQSGGNWEPRDFIHCGERQSHSQTPEQQATIMRSVFGG